MAGASNNVSDHSTTSLANALQLVIQVQVDSVIRPERV